LKLLISFFPPLGKLVNDYFQNEEQVFEFDVTVQKIFISSAQYINKSFVLKI